MTDIICFLSMMLAITSCHLTVQSGHSVDVCAAPFPGMPKLEDDFSNRKHALSSVCA